MSRTTASSGLFKLLKLVYLLIYFAFAAGIIYQIYDYWSGLAVFTFVSCSFLAALHLIVVIAVVWGFIQLCRNKA